MRTLALLLLTNVAYAYAISQPHYDLDSLVWQSRAIVEAEFVDVGKLRVVQCFHGDMKAGASLAPSLPFWESLKAGGRVFLFLEDGNTCVPSGAWLVVKGQVLRWHVSRRGGYGYPASPKEPTVDAFRKSLASRIRKALSLKVRLAAPVKPDDADGLLDLLRPRGKGSWEDDLVALKICQRLAELRDHDALAEALLLREDRRPRRMLARGFATPTGREYLLARIGDARVGLEKRTNLASVLEEAGAEYARKLAWTSGRWTGIGKLDPDNSRYLTRIATLARKVRVEERLCATICNQLEGLIQSGKRELAADVARVVPILAKLHGESGSERARYEIARALYEVGNSAYARLRSPAGPVIGIVRRVTEGWWQKTGHIHCVFEYQSMVAVRKSVFVYERGAEKFEVPVTNYFEPNCVGGGSFLVATPKKLKAGRCRVYLRLYLEGGGRSDSYSFVTDLP